MRKGLVPEAARESHPHSADSRVLSEIMRRKDDHHLPQQHRQQLSTSSSAFLVCYGLVFWDLTTAMWAGLAALFRRQIGHAVLGLRVRQGRPCWATTRSKALILGAYLLIGRVRGAGGLLDGRALSPLAAPVAQALFLWTWWSWGAWRISSAPGRVARVGLVRQAHHRSRADLLALASLSRGRGWRVTRAERRVAMSRRSPTPAAVSRAVLG